MQHILHIESSTEICSVALSVGDNLLLLKESDVSNSHTEKLTILISDCIKESGLTMLELDAIAISDGPGSYTSLRIGAATAKAMCYALNIPLISLGSLSILAHGVDLSLINAKDFIVPMIDARRMEVYSCLYDSKLNMLNENEAIVLTEKTFEHLMEHNACLHICGSGAHKYHEAFPNPYIKMHHTQTSAAFMVSLASLAYREKVFADIAYFSPNYLKDPNITKSTKKLF